MSHDPQSFEEFWSFYVGEHKNPVNRALHYAGTTMVIGTVAAAAMTLNPMWLLATPVVGYGPAWVGHFVFEKNMPATFKHPFWSLAGDFKMYGMALRGKMGEELARVAALEAEEEAPPVHTNGSSAGAHA
jgi:hypothetical protein